MYHSVMEPKGRENGDKMQGCVEIMERVDSWTSIGSSVQKTVRVDKALLIGLSYGNTLILRNCPRAGASKVNNLKIGREIHRVCYNGRM
jgi:hypothetical protein